INNSDIIDYFRFIDVIIEKYEKNVEIDENLIFVMMSYSNKNKNLEKYYRAMRSAVNSLGSLYNCLRIKDINSKSKRVSDEVMNNIRKCRLAIVDLTENRPNVFYELGYAEGISKDYIITAHIDTDLEFYPSEYGVIRYEDAFDLQEKLRYALEGELIVKAS
ncbi:MAG: hypothetical protein AAF809_15605, partial [Bacteroidota bacterium]